jgi:hypothetical protein
MLDWLYNVWTNQSVRYVAATAVGFVLAILAQQISTHFEHSRLRTTVREGLARELADNLSVLDDYLDTLRSNLQQCQQTWPLATLQTAILERCLDPSVNAVLTEIEQVQSAIAYQQCHALTEIMAHSREAIRQTPQRTHIVCRNVIDSRLPIVGQTLIDLLCIVLTEQQVFASTHSARMAHSLLPLYRANALSSDRTWRTKTIPDSQWKGPFTIAWVNDDAARVPVGIQIIELKPPEGSNRVINLQSATWYRRWSGPLTRRWQQRRLTRSIEQFGSQNQGPRESIRRLSDTTDGNKT